MSNIDRILNIKGKYFDVRRASAQELLIEMFPNTTRSLSESPYGLLEVWEALFQITPSDLSDYDGRRAVLVAKYTAVGGLNSAYFERIAKAFGYNIGTHAAGDPHLRISDGVYPPFRANISTIDEDSIWDQSTGFSAVTICVYGTNIESDLALKGLFIQYKPKGTEVVFINE
jgi:uncharacterized protein YmfQ (DUF2313 family)